MRRKFVAGNWKLNKTVEESVALAKELKAGIGSPSCDVAVAPTFLSLYAVAETLKGSGIAVALVCATAAVRDPGAPAAPGALGVTGAR